MRLVYLWIEKYKNIKNQGFNLAPDFDCKFDGESLTITEKKDYKSIFPSNISITAIVGENGSGKSSVLEMLFKPSKCNNIIIYIEDNILYINSDFLNIKNIKHSSQMSIKIQKEHKLNFSYVNIAGFSNDKISEDERYLHLNKDFSYPFDEQYYYNTFDTNKRVKNLKSNINYIHIFNFKEFKNFCKKYLNIKDIEYIKLKVVNNEHINYIQNNDINLVNYFQLLFLKFDFSQDKISDTNSKVLEEVTELLKNSLIDKNNNITFDVKNIEKLKALLVKICDIDFELLASFELTYLNKNKEQIYFSSGEQVLFFYMMQFEQISSNIFIVDEIDLYLHPNLQKSIFSMFVNNINSSVKQIIFATHSPFILSDLPKENILFLKDGKQVDVGIDTFGANIHTLLSHGFFMDNGLMGEFAKEKIDDVINFLNNKNSKTKDNEEAQNIINIIGEPIIKKQLQKMLDSKKIDYIADDVKEEIELLKHRITILSKRL